MKPTTITVDLERAVSRWRLVAYGLASAGLLVGYLITGADRAGAAGMFLLAGLALSWGHPRISLQHALIWDLVVSISLWWLFGPISGAALIALAVVAVGPVLLNARATRVLVGAALLIVPVETLAHFLADSTSLPLFHPPDPVPTSEFLIGQAIQAVLLLGVGALMTTVARMLRRGQEALAADLDRQRELNTLKDRFVATVSHQLRTPLTSIKGFTRTLLEDQVGPDERSEFLALMADQAEELHGRIEDLITFSRVSAGALTIQTRPVGLAVLIRGLLSDLGPGRRTSRFGSRRG